MSHLILDRRDWRFILRDQLDFGQLTKFPRYSDYDVDTLEAVLDEAFKFAVDKVAPLNPLGDKEGCRVENGRVFAPKSYHAVYKAYREAGWIAPSHGVEWGGQGLPVTLMCPITEAFTAACQAFHMYGGLTSGAGHLIESFGTEELKRKYVPKMYGGEWGGTMCLTEPQAGSAVGDLLTTATPQDDGTYLIEGTKIFISGGDSDFYGNVVHLVLARIKGDPAGSKGISLFVVPRDLVNDDGSCGASNNVWVTRIEEKMGIHGSATCQLSFGGDGPTLGWLVGQARQGLPYMFQMMNEARIACGLQAVALANASYQQALSYARDRKQGPDVTKKDLDGPSIAIINHPDVRRNLMLAKAYAEGTRSLLAQAAFWGDCAGSHPDESERQRAQDLADLATPICKAYSTDKGFRVTEIAIQIFGGYGYTREYPVEQYMRDCKISSLYEGTNGIQALDLLGRKMRLKGGALFMTYVMELTQFVESNRDNAAVTRAIETLSTAQGSLGEVAFWLASAGRAEIGKALMNATPFLELFGDIMVGHMLTLQATIASRKLVERIGTWQATAEQREKDDEVRFLAGKIDTARFFAAEVLAHVPGKARSIIDCETAALDMVF